MSEKEKQAIRDEYEKFSIDKLEQYSDAIEEKVRVDFDIEYQGKQDKVYVTVYKHFTKKRIFDCISEYINQIDILRKRKIDLDVNFLEMFLVFQMVKHFSDLDIPRDIEKQIIVMERLIDTGLLFFIFEEFEQKEIESLLREIDNANESLDENVKAIEEEFKKINFDNLESEALKQYVKE